MPVSIKKPSNPLKREGMLQRHTRQRGFSLVEMLISLTIALIIIGLTFGLLAGSLNKKARSDDETDSLSDGNQAISWMSQEIMNSGFGLKSNGLVAADSVEDKIRVRANLNAFLKQTTSGTVSDPDEDIQYYLLANPGSGSALVRADVGKNTSSVIATDIVDVDADGDGDGDGLTFDYLDVGGNPVLPTNAARIRVSVRILLPQIGVPGSEGFHPATTKVISSTVVLRNMRRMGY